MTALLFPTLQFWNALGTAPLSGGCIQAYITGTTTPLATALDSAGTAAPNPVPLDGGGRPNSGNGLWLNIGSSYDLLIYSTPTATGTPVETLTNVQSGNTGVAPNTASYVTVSAETNLSNERVLTAGGGVTILDGGSTVTIAQSSVVNAQTAGYTIISSDRGKFILYTGAGGVTLALTAAATLGNGFTFTIINRSSGTITVDPNGAELINGSATYALLTGAIITVYCDGTSFYTGPAFSTWTVPQGGTGVTTMTTAYCPVISGTTATGNLQTTATAGTSGQPLLSGGASALPAYGTLAVGGGGTGATTLTTAYGTLCAGTTATGTVQTVDPGTSGKPLVSSGNAALPAYGTLGLSGGGTGATTAAGAITAISPITTTGDIIYSSSGTTHSRLGIGTSSYLLNSSGTVPQWSSPSSLGSSLVFLGNLNNGNSFASTNIFTGYSSFYLISNGGAASNNGIKGNGNNLSVGFQLYDGSSYITASNVYIINACSTAGTAVNSGSASASTCVLLQAVSGQTSQIYNINIHLDMTGSTGATYSGTIAGFGPDTGKFVSASVSGLVPNGAGTIVGIKFIDGINPNVQIGSGFNIAVYGVRTS